MNHLLTAALAPSSKRTYTTAITSYRNFCNAQFPNIAAFPASAALLASYVAYLYADGYAPTTMLTHMSALSYMHKITGSPDHTQQFVVKKLITGAQNLSGRQDTRLPITKSVLSKIVHAINFVASSEYIQLLLKSMFLLAFHAFLRIGEITVHGPQSRHSVIQLKDITVSSAELSVSITHFKHNISHRPVILAIAATHDPNCPVAAILKFLNVRGPVQGPLFSFDKAYACTIHTGTREQFRIQWN